MAADEPVVHPAAPMPRGYCFVRKGNVYITAHCRRATRAAGRTVYVVSTEEGGGDTRPSSSSVMGLHCPAAICEAVREAERASRTARAAATQKRDAALAATFRDALLAAYPAVPRDTVAQVVQHALAKHERRVARTSTLDLGARVRLAVRAHIRHRCTDYEALLRGGAGSGGKTKKTKKTKATKTAAAKGMSREEARAQTVGQVDAIERQWAGRTAKDKKDRKDKKTKRAEARHQSRDKSGKGTGVETRAENPVAGHKKDKKDRKDRSHKANKDDRVQKTTATRPCKSEATARIARYQRWEARGNRRDEAIVIDSDSDWVPE